MILVFGSINVDVVVPVPHWPEAGETVLGGDYALLPGGKGANQALAARLAGAAVAFAGAVGDDGFAEIALDRLRREGVDLSLVQVVARPTGYAAIIVAATGENRIAVASGANMAAAAADVPTAMLGPGTTLLAQMEVPAVETMAMIHRAREAGGRTLLNLAPAAAIERGALAEVDILLANEGEAGSLGEAPARLARRLQQALVVTRGNAGAAAFLRDGRELTVPALAIAPVDTTGAGDTFAGMLATGLDGGLGLEAALRRASAAAGLACLARGAQTGMPDRAAIDGAVARLPAK